MGVTGAAIPDRITSRRRYLDPEREQRGEARMKPRGRLFGSMIWGRLLGITIVALSVMVIVVVDLLPVDLLYLALLLGVPVLGLYLGRRRVREVVSLSDRVCS